MKPLSPDSVEIMYGGMFPLKWGAKAPSRDGPN